ncbi:MAG TPA: di-heme oxidoredictase family protein [Blastocatellia bacterium]|nr:di-heme oxidoredictase family protein [Blastocatellia bacterium]
MKYLKILVLLLFAAALISPLAFTNSVEGQTITEALTTDMDGRSDDLWNGFPSGNLANTTAKAAFDDARTEFEAVETIADGVGPVYNAQSCRECHQTPDTGAASQITELRAGHLVGTTFVDAPGGSLINDRAIDARIQERISSADPVRTFRVSISVLGDGFVEALANTTLENNVAAQPAGLRGTLTNVEVFEDGTTLRRGRFGWKAQQASLLSFSADAYLNEMGITSNFAQTDAENTSNGVSVAAFDNCAICADPEDADNEDIQLFADFMRGTRAPGRGPITAAVTRGEGLFLALDCDVCHTPTFVTSAPGTLINGGAFTVQPALGNKRIHPYSDFALHDVGTGDGIVQNGGQGSRNQVRTAALWGVRARSRLMHDGESFTINDSILRHGGQALTIRNNYNALSTAQKQDLIAFVLSL